MRKKSSRHRLNFIKFRVNAIDPVISLLQSDSNNFLYRKREQIGYRKREQIGYRKREQIGRFS